MNILKRYSTLEEQKSIFGDKSTYMQHLFKNAQKDYLKLIPMGLRYVLCRILGNKITFRDMENVMISIDPDQGRLLYNMILSLKPSVVFEYGLSHGISSIYMAQALKSNKQGKVYSSEISKVKIDVAKKNIEQMALCEYINILEGDVLQSIEQIEDKIEFVVMDGFPDINLQVINKLEGKLTDNAVIITDDVSIFKKEMDDYLDYMKHGGIFSSVYINISSGMLYSVKC
ncbi:class I SAM-dependent methyltransferase [Gammaproteobacteria bacterium]|nr:class I SAM-dependent methyltransferase [Gammaproteobacteria bacterium]